MDFKNEKEELAFLRKYVTDIKKQYIDEKALSKNGKQYFAMRVSTKRIIEKENKEEKTEAVYLQDFDRQKYIFKNAGYLLTDNNTFADRVTGSSTAEQRPKYSEMLNLLTEGDTVYFCDVSRFSRNYINGMAMLDELVFDKKVNVVFVGDNKKLYSGKRFDANEWFYISMMLLSAEYQKRCIGQTTSQKLRAMQNDGKTLGRPSLLNDTIKNDIIEDRTNGMAVKDIVAKYNITKPTMTKVLKEAGLVREYNRV